jgi:hypothetical protein
MSTDGGGLLGGGGFFGRGGEQMGPRGPFGMWPTCGCSSLLIIVAGMLLVCAGFFRMFDF